MAGSVSDVTATNANYALVIASGYAGRADDAAAAAKQGYHLIEQSTGAAPMVFGITEHTSKRWSSPDTNQKRKRLPNSGHTKPSIFQSLPPRLPHYSSAMFNSVRTCARCAGIA